MKTRITDANPFGRSFRLDHAFAWEKVGLLVESHSTALKVLDYGAHDGRMLRICLESGLPLEAYGVDANKSAIERGRGEISSGVSLRLGDVSDLEGFASAAHGFDVVCMMGVLEHVRRQAALLARLRASLRTGGTLMMSVPGRHFLSWLDFGNWKFYFPKIHRLFIETTKGRAHYREKFVECRNGLFGDIEVGKKEHQHFARAELTSLLERNGFKVEVVDGYGFFFRLLHNVWWLSPRPVKRWMEPMIRADLRVGGRAELVVCARRL
jgi:SAM-dependent methyltransferase